MHLVLFLLVLGSGLPSTMAQPPETSTPIDQSSTEAGTTDVQQVSNTAPDSTLSPDPRSNSTYPNSTLSADTTTHSNDSNAPDNSMDVTAIYTPTMTPVEISSTPPATTKKGVQTTKPLSPDTGDNTGVQTTKPPSPDTGDNTVTVIIVVIILAAVIIGTLCFISRKRSRRYSVDLRSVNQEEAEVPLSTVEAEGAANSVSRNGMQTFSGTTAEAKDPTPVTEAKDPTPVTEAKDPTPVTEAKDPTPVTEVKDPTPVTDAEKEQEEKGEKLGSSSSEIHQDNQA